MGHRRRGGGGRRATGAPLRIYVYDLPSHIVFEWDQSDFVHAPAPMAGRGGTNSSGSSIGSATGGMAHDTGRDGPGGRAGRGMPEGRWRGPGHDAIYGAYAWFEALLLADTATR